jgi:hypothetical protein
MDHLVKSEYKPEATGYRLFAARNGFGEILLVKALVLYEQLN